MLFLFLDKWYTYIRGGFVKKVNIERKEITSLISNMDLEGLSKVQIFLNDMDKKVIISKANDIKTISYILNYLHVFNINERKVLIKKCQNKLYDLMCECFESLSKEEISYIVMLLCNDIKIDMIFDVISNFKCSLSEEDIDNIVMCVTTVEKDPWELVNLLKILQFKLSNSNVDSIIKCLCDIKCIESLICILKDFNRVLSYNNMVDIITVVFDNDKKGLYLSELIKIIDYSILNENDIKFIIDKICLQNQESIPNLIYYIKNQLDNNLTNYMIEKLYNENKITISTAHVFIENFLENMSNISISYIVKSICNLKDCSYLITLCKKLINYMSNEDLDEIIKSVCIKRNPYSIVEISKVLSTRLNDMHIELLANTLIEINNIKFLYQFSLEFYNRFSDELRNKITNQILNSFEYKYIILYAIFVSAELIEMLFDNVESMYIYIISSGLFKVDEIKLINEKLNIKPAKPDVYKTLNLIYDNDMKI